MGENEDNSGNAYNENHSSRTVRAAMPRAKTSKQIIDSPAADTARATFPNGIVTINVSGANLHCGARAIAKSISAQFPDAAIRLSHHDVLKWQHDSELRELNAVVGLHNDNNHYAEQLAGMLRLAGHVMNPIRSLQLGLLIQDPTTNDRVTAQLMPWPLPTPPSDRVWIYLGNHSISETKGGPYGHFQAVARPFSAAEQQAEIAEGQVPAHVAAGLNQLNQLNDLNNDESKQGNANEVQEQVTKNKTIQLDSFARSKKSNASQESKGSKPTDFARQKIAGAFEQQLTKDFGPLNFKAETLPTAAVREKVKVYDAYVLDEHNSAIVEFNDQPITTYLTLRADLFRPYYKVTSKLEPRSASKSAGKESAVDSSTLHKDDSGSTKEPEGGNASPALDIDATQNSAVEQQETEQDDQTPGWGEPIKAVPQDQPRKEMIVADDEDLSEVYAMYTCQTLTGSKDPFRGIRITNLSHVSILSKAQQQEVQAMPQATKDIINKISNRGGSPILLDLFHDGRFLSRGIYYNTPAWAVHTATSLKHVVTTKAGADSSKQQSWTRILVSGYPDMTLRQIRVLARLMDNDPNPVLRYHKGKKRLSFTRKTLAEIGNLQNTGFTRFIQFVDIIEYATIQYLTHEKEHEIITARVEKFNEAEHVVHMIECRTVQNEAVYYAFLETTYGIVNNEDVDEEIDVFRPRHGDTFSISFNEDETFDSLKGLWTFKVLEPVGLVDNSYVCGVMIRPWLKDIRAFNADDPSTTLLDQHMDIQEAQTFVKSSKGNRCLLRVNLQDKVEKNIFASFDRLVFAGRNSAFTEFNRRINNVLVARRIDELPEHDFFASAKQALNTTSVLDLMSLDNEQKKAVSGMENAVGGISITQGPPGTGKTYTIKQTCIPFLLTPPGTGVHIIFSPSNSGADDLAENINLLINDLMEQPGLVEKYPHIEHEEECFVVRLHSKTTERSISDLSLVETRPENARPPTFRDDLDELQTSLSQAEWILHNALMRNQETKIKNIRDPRVTHLGLSMGAYMLKAVGLWVDEDANSSPAWPGYEDHARYGILLRQKVREGELPEHLAEEFGRAHLALYTEVLRNARVVVGTTANIASRGVMEILADCTIAVTAEENAREAEHNILPILATRFTQNPGMHLVGDQGQLKPTSQVNKVHCVTAKQKETALMTRLILAGFPYTMLKEQRRMVSDIVRPISENFYSNQLISGPDLDKRRGAALFRSFANSITGGRRGIRTSIVGINFNCPVDSQNAKVKYQVVTSESGSKSCDFQAMYGVSLATHLLDTMLPTMPNVTIAILSQYTDQRNLYLKALANMRVKDAQGWTQLVVDTVDGSQGREFDFVILDTVFDRKIGMMDDQKRVNVAFTRARLGLIWLFNELAILRGRGNAAALKKMHKHLQEKKLIWSVGTGISDFKRWPQTEYLLPHDSVEAAQNLLVGMRTTAELLKTVSSETVRPLQQKLAFDKGELLEEHLAELVVLQTQQEGSTQREQGETQCSEGASEGGNASEVSIHDSSEDDRHFTVKPKKEGYATKDDNNKQIAAFQKLKAKLLLEPESDYDQWETESENQSETQSETQSVQSPQVDPVIEVEDGVLPESETPEKQTAAMAHHQANSESPKDPHKAGGTDGMSVSHAVLPQSLSQEQKQELINMFRAMSQEDVDRMLAFRNPTPVSSTKVSDPVSTGEGESTNPHVASNSSPAIVPAAVVGDIKAPNENENSIEDTKPPSSVTTVQPEGPVEDKQTPPPEPVANPEEPTKDQEPSPPEPVANPKESSKDDKAPSPTATPLTGQPADVSQSARKSGRKRKSTAKKQIGASNTKWDEGATQEAPDGGW